MGVEIKMDEDYKVKSLVKAMHVLECFSVKNTELGISDIARQLDLQKSTVHNILSTFEKMGYVTQNHQTGRYSLGLKMLSFSYVINSHLDLRRVFTPYMHQIAQAVNEVCYLGIPYGSSVMYLEAAYPQYSSSTRSITGETAPMYCTGLGKVMLAFMPEEEREAILQQPRVKFTDYTITDVGVLRDNLEEVRINGFSTDNMEHEYGIRCVAVPIFGVDGRLVASISVSGPSPRFDPQTIVRDADTLRRLIEPVQHRL